MILQTHIDIKQAPFGIQPKDRLLFVGSCFADSIGRRFSDNMFRATVNPNGVMYNPASILHTVRSVSHEAYDIAVFTLGTNHVYILNETGEIVDNCQKRPQRLFTEKELTVSECTEYLAEAIRLLMESNPSVRVIVTVSPIRYQKYGFHESQISKATLLLATECLKTMFPTVISYYPAYEIMNDELRDYRFYAPDMLHPSEQAVDFIYERFMETYFSEDAVCFYEEWQPIRRALLHRPFNPDSEETKAFKAKAMLNKQKFIEKWNL